MTEEEVDRIVNPPLIGFSDADAIVHWYGWPVSFNDFRVLDALDEAARDVVLRMLRAVRDAERTRCYQIADEALMTYLEPADDRQEGYLAAALEIADSIHLGEKRT